MTILEVDAGNTRCKWRLLESGQAGAVQAASEPLAHWQSAGYASLGIERVRISSVVGEKAEPLLAWCREHLRLEPELAKVQQVCAGLTQGYERAEQLGVDRWLACLAAWRKSGACSVMSLGTAITLDCIDAEGKHRGGYIAPGLGLLQSALTDHTQAIKLEFIEQLEGVAPGRNTQGCVEGALAGMVSGLLSLADSSRPLYICGGDRERVTALLPAQAVVCDTLVFDGLALALP